MSPVEALARAMRLDRYGEMRPLWEDMPPEGKQAWVNHADFVVRHMPGFVIVPLWPTQAMIEAVGDLDNECHIYRAMLAAAEVKAAEAQEP